MEPGLLFGAFGRRGRADLPASGRRAGAGEPTRYRSAAGPQQVAGRGAPLSALLQLRRRGQAAVESATAGRGCAEPRTAPCAATWVSGGPAAPRRPSASRLPAPRRGGLPGSRPRRKGPGDWADPSFSSVPPSPGCRATEAASRGVASSVQLPGDRKSGVLKLEVRFRFIHATTRYIDLQSVSAFYHIRNLNISAIHLAGFKFLFGRSYRAWGQM